MTIKDPSKHSVFTCKWCNRQFEDWTYRNPTFCSAQCRSEFGAHQPKPNTRRPENFVHLICKQCGNSYIVHKVQLDKPYGCKYCSKKCKYDAVGFSMRGSNNVNYTDGESSKRGPNWNYQKRSALRRDNFTCQICGEQKIKGRNPDVHHIVKFGKFNGDFEKCNDLSNLITLCRKCHRGIESGKIALDASTFAQCD